MKKLLALILTLFALASCEKEHEPLASWPEGSPDIIDYYGGTGLDLAYIWIDIVDAAGQSLSGSLEHGEVSDKIYEAPQSSGCEWSVARLYNEGSCIRIRTDKLADCNEYPSQEITYRMKSPDLFGDNEEHTFEYVVDRKVGTVEKYGLNHYHTATALTFDGRAVEPDADGVFVIRLAE